MEKVIIEESANLYLNELIKILFGDEYFGFMESSINYVNKIYDFIYSIPTQVKRNTKNSKFGFYYCSFKINTKTTWYVIFNFHQNTYLVTHILNNHTSDYPYLIK